MLFLLLIYGFYDPMAWSVHSNCLPIFRPFLPCSVIFDANHPYIAFPCMLRFFPHLHNYRYSPPSEFIMMMDYSGFKCSGCEPGLGHCNPTKPNCLSTDHVLALTCAKPEPALTNTGIVYYANFACAIQYITYQVLQKLSLY